MATAILVRKRRFTATDIQRETLQRQISGYAERHRAELAKTELQTRRERAAALQSEPASFHEMETFIGQMQRAVDRYFAPACPLCGVQSEGLQFHASGCPDSQPQEQ